MSTKVRVLRHAGLGRPAGHADTPLDDQQAMLILPWTTSRPCRDSIRLTVLCYCSMMRSPSLDILKGLASQLCNQGRRIIVSAPHSDGPGETG